MQYYIANGKQPLGPFDLNQLRDEYHSGDTGVESKYAGLAEG